MTHSDITEEGTKEKPDDIQAAQAGPASTDQVILATAGYDHTIKFWAAHSGVCTRTHQHPDSQVNCLEITPDGNMLAAGGYQHIRMYDLTSGNLNPIVNYDQGITKNVMAVGCQDDGKWMYTGGEDCSARIWDLKMRNLSCQRIFQANAPVNSVCLHPNQQELIVGDQAGVIHRWNLKNDQSEQLIPEPGTAIQHIDIDPVGQYMAVVNSKGKCYIWSLSTGEDNTQLLPKIQIPAHDKYALCCKFSPDSSLLATTSADQTCKIWRTSDFSLQEVNPVHELTCETQRWVWDCSFTADSAYIVTASSDGAARLWNTKSGALKREYLGHQKALTSVAFRDISHVK
ncbi:target of rapamycin complex subunit lst8 isoform X2 [Eurytemora carolleeae]|uniref:target of rapamycin complex subunit lst8 isoform X1 n=1 Tax=Eurytemora carolleeae TaxID=1294199 RepID=UPI000C790B82|nr:target of rapamycin complex subunit lst8 isoform X1 [Eurytemora carolleeae]XP_023347123.1 target of rapamycin complex subunit lst8 isoform X2 [Eurytemora carolleeae]|eukprot:XP_023347122.1 target of rapamycin complex subunit lst8-like isoform X1 [Eurytemora affinis]